jgi:SAM-dependent methyltransferase
MILTADELATPTELCRLMEKWGSDKGRENITNWKHNYTVVYTKLFAGLRDKPLRIFELGLGTNNVYLASTMAVNGVPGASLRAWEEYFPAAAVFGADIDRDILFAEGRVKTFFCDQTSPDAIRTLWSEPDLSDGFDIIVEDGLHTFDANVCFFENSVNKLRAGGIYIIEDITRPDLPRFEEKLVAWRRQFPGLTFELVDIPCTVNDYDNIILIVKNNV